MKEFIKKILIKVGLYPKPVAHFVPKVVEQYEQRIIRDGQTGNNYIKEKILSNKPLLVGKLGSVELSAIVNYIRLKEKQVKTWNRDVLYTLYNNAGFFPIDKTSCNKLAEFFIECITKVDILGAWFNEGEDWVTEKYCPLAYLTRLRALEPYYHENPWSEALAGKTVLVIHPFAESIMHQYQENNTKLFADKRILPTFTLKTIKAVQSIADNKQEIPFKDWFEAYNYMCAQIQRKQYDVAIIGAGAYGLPLAAFVKSIGKQGIHIGGATQILFGIFGNRWENNKIISGFRNEHWTRPALHERPRGLDKVEGACYW